MCVACTVSPSESSIQTVIAQTQDSQLIQKTEEIQTSKPSPTIKPTRIPTNTPIVQDCKLEAATFMARTSPYANLLVTKLSSPPTNPTEIDSMIDDLLEFQQRISDTEGGDCVNPGKKLVIDGLDQFIKGLRAVKNGRYDSQNIHQVETGFSMVSTGLEQINSLIQGLDTPIPPIYLFEQENGDVNISETSNLYSTRCTLASQSQFDNIIKAVQYLRSDHYIKKAYAVKSNDYQNAWFVSAKVYSQGNDIPTSPGVWIIIGDPNDPTIIGSVNSIAQEFTLYPDTSKGSIAATMSKDGAIEAENCAFEN